MSFLINPFWFSSDFTPEAVPFFDGDTAVLPFLSAASYPHAAYVAALDKTFITWERVPSPHVSSVAAIISYDHTLDEWSTVYDMATWFDTVLPTSQVAHGQPVIVYGPDSHFYTLFASHNTTQYMASSTNADDISKWNAPTSFGSKYTYPKPVVIGSEIHCLWRSNTGSNLVLLHRKGTPTAGSLTFGAEKQLVDLNPGGGSNIYASEVHVVGTAIHFTFVDADYLGSPRKHVYYAIYETTTGELSNVDGSTVVASGSLPINLTTANANFRIFTSPGSNVGTLSSFNFDTSGNAHVTYGDGVPDSLGRIQGYHTFWNGSTWSTPATIAMVESGNYLALVPGASGAMEVWYPQDDGDAYVSGGTMCRRTWNGSTWAAQEVMATVPGSYPLDRAFSIRDAHHNLRVAFCEYITSQDYTAPDFLKRYAHGASGWAIGPDPAVLQYAADAGSDVLHVRVNDNSRIIDYTGNHLTITGATVSGTEMVFDGTNDYVTLIDSAGYTPSADWTLQFDGLKFADVTTLQCIIGHVNGGAAGVSSWRVQTNSTVIALEANIGAGFTTILSYAWSKVLNQSYNVALERKGNTVYLYIDDLTTGNHVASAAMATTFVATTSPLTIGAEYNTDVTDDHRRYFNGRMSKVRLVHSALYAA